MLLQLLAALCCASIVSSLVIPIKLQAASPVTESAEETDLSHGYWVTNITIGTPGQTFSVIIDTFSATTWLTDMACMKQPQGCSKPMYNSMLSSTYQAVNNSMFLMSDHFGSGAGMVGKDTIQLGNGDGKAVVVPSATFGQVYQIPASVRAVPQVVGVLGLAFQSLALPKTVPVLQTASTQGDVTAQIVTIWVEDQWSTSDNGTAGVIYYGNNDPLHCKTRVDHPLSKAQYYQVTLPSFGVNGRTIYFKPTQTIIDTTSPYISVPPQVVHYILGYLGIDVNTPLPATVPCNTMIDLALNFNGETEDVTQLNLMLKQADGTCKLAILQSVSKNFDNGLRFELGIPFMRGRCIFFNMDQHTLGFADAISHHGH